ncbi:LicD family protein [Gammaproteobacteria bacterium]|nr:LicD family protein [Gammaproteobacteria bacterium]
MASANKLSELRLMQLLVLIVIREIDRVCNVLNLKYYAIAGTLLGVYRHRGFIPWDTDADIGMLREDYDKLMSTAANVVGTDFVLQSDESDIRNPTCFARLRLRQTRVIERGNIRDDDLNGFYVDIFPIDNYLSPGFLEFIAHKLFKLAVRVKAFRAGKKFSSTRLRTLAGFLLHFLFLWVPTSFLKQGLHAYVTRYSRVTTDLVTNFNSKYGLRRQTMSRSVYGIGVRETFEGISIFTPRDSSRWLKNIYSDYMKMPRVPDLDLSSLLPSYTFDFGPYSYLLDLTEEEARCELGLPKLSDDCHSVDEDCYGA